jgi:hypothetical protein
MNLKKKYKLGIAILLASVIILFVASLLISSLISKKIVDMLTNQKIENYHLSIDKTKFNLFDRSMVFNEILLSPSDSSMVKLKKNVSDLNELHKISISRFKLRGIQLFPLLLSKKLIISKLIIDDPLYQRFNNGKKIKSVEKKKPIKLDSILIKDIGGFELDMIKVSNLKFQVINIVTDKITFENEPMSFELSGFKLEKVDIHVFKLLPVDKIFEMSNIHMNFPDKKYGFSLGKLQYNFDDDQLLIKNLSYKPSINKAKLANSYRFNSDVYTIDLKELKIFKLDLKKIFQNEGLFMDSIQISQFSIDIYKDKRKPFDENKRPEFPHDLLKKMELPILIPKISIEDSQLFYEEKLEKKDASMKVTLNELNINIHNATSIKEYREESLKIEMNSKFMNKVPLYVKMDLPLKDGHNTFFFSGKLGASPLKYYESILVPALGVKVLNGDLKSLTFQASANNYSSEGTMTMLYSDLEAEVRKQNNSEKRGFVSWSVNTLVHKSNPGNKGHERKVMMNFNRVSYKGFGNILWKTLQSGIVNTIAPFGQTKEKADAKKQRQEKRDEKKRNK